MGVLLKILHFFSLVDNDQKLSLTSIGLYTVLFKLAMSPNPGLTDVGALLLVLLNYAHKRTVNTEAAAAAVANAAKTVDGVEETAKQLSDLVSKVNALSIKVGITR